MSNMFYQNIFRNQSRTKALRPLGYDVFQWESEREHQPDEYLWYGHPSHNERYCQGWGFINS